MQAAWSGAIAFGLVNIPIKLYVATRDTTLDLDMLDSRDLHQVKYKRVNEESGKEVPWANIVKGYKLNGKYVVLEEADFKKAAPQQSQELNLDFFCEASSIPSLFYEATYLAQPEKTGGKAYTLLRDALTKAKKVAVGSMVMRNREHICVVLPYGEWLLVQRIHYLDDIHIPESVSGLSNTSVKPAELKMAQTLVDQMSQPFNIKNYKDTYHEKLLEFIKAKAKGKKINTPPLRVVHKASNDLMDQLKASLGAKRKKKAS
jgi:DNA end-binding protein Ku